MVRKRAIIFFVAAFLATSISAGILGDAEYRQTVRRIISLRFDHRYAEADSLTGELAEGYGNDPAIYFLRASNLHDMMHHREDFRRTTEMEALLDSAIALASADTSDPWNLWIIGSSQGYRALARAERGEYLPAYRLSRRAYSMLKRAAAHRETRADALMGMGGYDYWKSAKLGFLVSLPLISDDREEGARALETARDSSVYSREAALHALVYVYCEEGDIPSAKEARNLVADAHPRSLLPLWYDIAIASAAGNAAEYSTAADMLLFALDTIGTEQIANILELRAMSAEAAAGRDNWEEVCRHCLALEKLEIPEWTSLAKSEQLELLKDLCEEAEERGFRCR